MPSMRVHCINHVSHSPAAAASTLPIFTSKTEEDEFNAAWMNFTKQSSIDQVHDNWYWLAYQLEPGAVGLAHRGLVWGQRGRWGKRSRVCICCPSSTLPNGQLAPPMVLPTPVRPRAMCSSCSIQCWFHVLQRPLLACSIAHLHKGLVLLGR
jgi:hypothetical protein